MAEIISRIAWLEKQIKTVEKFVETHKKALNEGQATFSDKISYNTNRSLLNNYKKELRLEKELLAKEVFEFRLIGESVNKGTIPLPLLGKLSDHLSKAIHYTAHFVRNKTNAVRGVGHEIANGLDLRLSDVEIGSCRLKIIGNVHDDLAGDSLLGDAYKSIFEILREEDEITFSNISPIIGNSAVKNLDHLLEEVQNNNLALELKWDAPNGEHFKWGGSKESVITARQKLEKIKDLEPVDLDISGKITDLSVNGTLKILEKDAKKALIIKFKKEMMIKVDSLTLNDFVTASVTRNSILDEVTGEEKHTYHLNDISKY